MKALITIMILGLTISCGKGVQKNSLDTGNGIDGGYTPNPFPYPQVSDCAGHYDISPIRNFTTPGATNTLNSNDKLATNVDSDQNTLDVDVLGGSTSGSLCYYIKGSDNQGTIHISQDMAGLVINVAGTDSRVRVDIDPGVQVADFLVRAGAVGVSIEVVTDDSNNCPDEKWNSAANTSIGCIY
jgi:hypothetical protein